MEEEDRLKKLQEFENFISTLKEDEKLKLFDTVLGKSSNSLSKKDEFEGLQNKNLSDSRKLEAMQKLYA